MLRIPKAKIQHQPFCGGPRILPSVDSPEIHGPCLPRCTGHDKSFDVVPRAVDVKGHFIKIINILRTKVLGVVYQILIRPQHELRRQSTNDLHSQAMTASHTARECHAHENIRPEESRDVFWERRAPVFVVDPCEQTERGEGNRNLKQGSPDMSGRSPSNSKALAVTLHLLNPVFLMENSWIILLVGRLSPG